MFLAKKLNKGAGAPEPKDPQFNYVTMLLHGDGTNGAQNNTFLDSSASPLTITRNGNTTQGSFSPFGSNWSNYFNGTGNYLTVSSTLDLSTSNYTIEFWFSGSIFELSWGTSGAYSPFSINSSGAIYFANSSNNAWIYNLNNFIITDNTWNHYAIVRNSGVVYLYRNGVQVGTSSAPSSSSPNGNVVIGYYNSGAIGYVSNLRCVIGTAVYTSAFTPSTTPLTAITNTALLTCQSNRFIDNSASPLTITVTGAPSVQRFNPFGTATAYSTSVIGGSGYFDGSGDYLAVPGGSQFNFASNDFTIEAWVYINDSNTRKYISGPGTDTSSHYDGFGLEIFDNRLCMWASSVANSWNLLECDTPSNRGNILIPVKAWTHVAAVRTGGNTFKSYVNGVLDRTFVVSGSISNTANPQYNIGRSAYLSGTFYFNGLISNYRVVNGTAVYTSNFTPSTAPLTAITNTSLLLNTTNAGIFDNAMMNDLETVGNGKISTSVAKFGTGSINGFNASNCQIVSYAGATIGNFGAGDFTVELWLNTNTANGAGILTQATSGGPAATSWGFFVGYASATSIDFYVSNVSSYFANTGGGVINDSTWHHVAFSRSGSSGKLFVDGTQVGSTLSLGTTALGNGTLPINIGGQGDSGHMAQGYIDDVRITKGYARYTSNFTPPTAAFSNTGPT